MAEAGAWSSWPAPAKLNLFLHVTGRRADGYHLLQTAFQILDWGDTIRLRAREDGRVVRDRTHAGIAAANDLCVRAAAALQARTGCGRGADIELDKRIPIGGGLGGGSSDAATVLLGLNEIWNTGLDEDELADLAVGLGADVPLFARGRSAWAEGIGERLTPLALPLRHYAIVDPGVAVATTPLFQAFELTRNCAPTTISDFLAGTPTSNVFAPLVRARHPQVDDAFAWLGRHGDARLTGSGGCVFVATQTAQAAQAIVRECPPAFVAWVARGVDRSPLLAARDAYRRERAD